MRAPAATLRVGCDVVDIARFRTALVRGGEGFAAELFSANELAELHSDHTTMARLFAVKEAAMKAIGVGLIQGVGPRQFEVKTLEHGRHQVELNGSLRLLACSELRANCAWARAWLVHRQEDA